jgi:hypothetical protein
MAAALVPGGSSFGRGRHCEEPMLQGRPGPLSISGRSVSPQRVIVPLLGVSET